MLFVSEILSHTKSNDVSFSATDLTVIKVFCLSQIWHMCYVTHGMKIQTAVENFQFMYFWPFVCSMFSLFGFSFIAGFILLFVIIANSWNCFSSHSKCWLIFEFAVRHIPLVSPRKSSGILTKDIRSQQLLLKNSSLQKPASVNGSHNLAILLSSFSSPLFVPTSTCVAHPHLFSHHLLLNVLAGTP